MGLCRVRKSLRTSCDQRRAAPIAPRIPVEQGKAGSFWRGRRALTLFMTDTDLEVMQEELAVFDLSSQEAEPTGETHPDRVDAVRASKDQSHVK